MRNYGFCQYNIVWYKTCFQSWILLEFQSKEFYCKNSPFMSSLRMSYAGHAGYFRTNTLDGSLPISNQTNH